MDEEQLFHADTQETLPVVPYDEPRNRGQQEPWIANPMAHRSARFGRYALVCLLLWFFLLAGIRSSIRTPVLILIGLFTGFIVCSVIALITGIVGLRRAARPWVEGRSAAVAGLLLGLGGVLLTFLAAGSVFMLQRGINRAQNIKCQAHLRIIGRSWAAYLADYGQYPSSLQQLEGYMTGDLLSCPAADDSASDTCSYLYLGANLTPASPPNSPVACDRLTNHDGKGITVLHANGTVSWLDRKQAAKLLTGISSLTQPTSMPSAR